MNPNPKSAKKKIAFTGTNCSGKTTMALEVTARLKAQDHYLAEVVSSQDRKVTWKDDHFPVDPRAHYGMITNLIHAEVQAELKGDADVVITDRSALDLYAIALTDHPESDLIHALGVAVEAWVKTYTKIFYLPPLPYQEDGKRPADDFRMKTHAKLIELIDSSRFPNVEKIEDRTTVMSKVRSALNITPKPCLAPDVKWQFVANSFKAPLAVKSPEWPTSDWDVWVLDGHANADQVKALVTNVFGPIPVHVMPLPLEAQSALESQHQVRVYYPVPG